MDNEIRAPEYLLDQLFQTGQSWMAARAAQRAVGPPTEPGKGTVPTGQEDLAGQERTTRAAAELRERFRELAHEFIDRVEEL